MSDLGHFLPFQLGFAMSDNPAEADIGAPAFMTTRASLVSGMPRRNRHARALPFEERRRFATRPSL